VRYRLMASYQGSPFEAGMGPAQGDIVLFAACPPPEDLGFEPATGHWRKQLRLGEVQAVWESRPVGTFRGQRCMVLDDLGDRLHIGYLGHDGFQAEQLGYWQVDRGVFELVAPRSEVTEIIEERTEYPGAGSHPSAGPLPAVSPGSGSYARPSERPSGQYSVPPGYGSAVSGQRPAAVAQSPAASGQHPIPVAQSPAASGQHPIPGTYRPAASGQHLIPDDSASIALPVAAPAPLPLEAEALRAASEARRPRPAVRRSAPAGLTPEPPVAKPAPIVAEPVRMIADAAPARPPRASAETRQRRSARSRLATERLFADLASLAGIPAQSYAIGELVDGAMCLVQTEQGFEVFHAAGRDRQELQVFTTEESACFYLFGVLAAEALRNGSLGRLSAGSLPGGQPGRPDSA
jgi:hypothetical protein